MIEIGKKQKLIIQRFTDNGAYLKEDLNDYEESVLLPKKFLGEDAKEGQEIEVFVYNDSKDRPIATTQTPLLEVGQIGVLTAVEVTKIGAFLDWGLEKDLFLPFKEQKTNIAKGQSYLVSVYIDKSNRMCATTFVNKMIVGESTYKVDDTVKGTVYGVSREYGVFVAVDNKYSALIPSNEIFDDYALGDVVEARVTKVKEDGKLDLSVRQKAYREMSSDTQKVMDKLMANYGKYHLNDSSSPQAIKKELQMSKRAFKRAIGNLMKSEKIVQTKDGLELLQS